MSQQLISHSPDLKRLRDDGYDIEIREGYLLLKDVPYVNSRKEIRRGTLVSELTLAGERTARPSTHVVHFVGEHPCTNHGGIITAIQHGSQRTPLAEDLIIDHSFSNKPAGGYPDYYAKMTRYLTIIANYAEAIDPTVTAKTYPAIPADDTEGVFHYTDTATSRAQIGMVNRKLALGRIDILGVGGTGSYILDLVAKTPVRSIHLHDGDTFSQHNAFRSPGAPSIDELQRKPQKAAYFCELYSRMHRHIAAHRHIDEGNVNQLRDSDFVFLCLEGGTTKKFIIERLETFGTPFIDVGMGVDLVDESLGGILRTTTSTPSRRDHVRERIPFNDRDENNEYDRNIQIADLNALNATLAVIKWKKFCGFYRDLEHEHHSTYTIDGNTLINEEQG